MIIGPEGGVFRADGCRAGGAARLAVLLHAFGQTPATLQRVAEIVREAEPGTDIFAPRLPLGPFSCADPDAVADGIADEVERLDRERAVRVGTGYAAIVFDGHSAGAVLARKAVAAAIERRGDPDGPDHWTARTERIVLLAAMSRGWRVSSALDPLVRLQWSFGAALGHLLRHPFGLHLFIMGLRRGAPFLTRARLQWLRLADRMPLTVQLLGTDDDYVAPTDNVDFATGTDFIYLEVPRATHRGIVDLDRGASGPEGTAIFRLALEAPRAALLARSLKRADIFDIFDESADDHDASVPGTIDRETGLVLFVVHGIRDRGFWTRRLARYIKGRARERGIRCRAVTSTYGYFPMGPFLLPWVRHDKVEWLLDQYVTAASLYPAATFAYIGHSNGTYLLARALQLCPDLRFERVVFAGSVVADGYDWPDHAARDHAARDHAARGDASDHGRGGVGRVLNYVASADWVVAVFPNGLGKLHLQRDLGGAGHNGFLLGEDRLGPAATDVADLRTPRAMVTNVRFVPGSHSAGLTVENWSDMADFVLDGRLPLAANAAVRPDPTIARLGRWSGAVWILLGLLAAALLAAPWLALHAAGGWPGVFAGVALLAVLGLLKAVLTKA